MEPPSPQSPPARAPRRPGRALYALAYAAAIGGIFALKGESRHIEATLDGATMLLVSWGWTLPVLVLLAVVALLRYRASLPPRTKLTTFVVLVALFSLLPTAALCYINRAFASGVEVERFATVAAKHRVVRHSDEWLSVDFAVDGAGALQTLTVPPVLYARVEEGQRVLLSMRKGRLGYWYVSGIDPPAATERP